MKVVVKIGSALLTDGQQTLKRENFCRLIAECAALKARGAELVIVTSGAVAMGRYMMGGVARPDRQREIPRLQALAALGQSRLIRLYEHEFAFYGVEVAQILLTRDDFNDRRRYINARNAMDAILEMGAIPVVNENDSIAADEIRVGDNDQLAAMVAGAINATHLILLSDIDGLYTKNPKKYDDARKIDVADALDPALDVMVDDAISGVGTGGMTTKILAARICAQAGIPTIIASGLARGVLLEALGEQCPGTRLLPKDEPVAARKAWIGTSTSTSGCLRIDAGAEAALKAGKSLLAIGIVGVEGSFLCGDTVELIAPSGVVIARGLASYDSRDILQILGRKSAEIADLLGFSNGDAVVHADDILKLT